MPRVLVVDGDVAARDDLTLALATRGLAIEVAASIPEAEIVMRTVSPDLAIVDSAMPIARLRKFDERVLILAISVDETHAVTGADQVISRSLDSGSVFAIVQRMLDVQRTRRRSLAANVAEVRNPVEPFVGTSKVIRQLAEHAHRVLDSHAPILIRGETGTGKGVLANWFHGHGPRAEEAFVDINCAGLSKEFLETELFGHERGAFTGANASKLGLLDVAHRGTAFLDEIGEMDLLLQPRLLKVLEDKRFRRLGDVRDRVVDIRLIAATNRDLARRAREGTFRADLYYRINTLSLTVPPLRHRREDIPLLARKIANTLGHDVELVPESLRAMDAYDWPGNVRELRNVIERAILISNRAPKITPKDLRFEVGIGAEVDESPDDNPDAMTLANAERRHIERVLKLENGSVERAAVRLGVSRSTLYQKLRRYRTED